MIKLLVKNYFRHWRINIMLVILITIGISLPVIVDGILLGRLAAISHFAEHAVLGCNAIIEFDGKAKVSQLELDSKLQVHYPGNFLDGAVYSFVTTNDTKESPGVILYPDVRNEGMGLNVVIRSDMDSGACIIVSSTADRFGLKNGQEVFIANPNSNYRSPISARVHIVEQNNFPLSIPFLCYISQKDAEQLNLKIRSFSYRIHFTQAPSALPAELELNGQYYSTNNPMPLFTESNLFALPDKVLDLLDDNEQLSQNMKVLSFVFVGLAAYSAWIAVSLGMNIRRREFALMRSLGMEDFSFTGVLLLELVFGLLIALLLSVFVIGTTDILSRLLPVSPIGYLGEYGNILSINGHGVFKPDVANIFFWFGLFSFSVLISSSIPIFTVRKSSIMSMWRDE